MTVVDPIEKLCPLKKLLFTEGFDVQLSVAVGAVQLAIALVPVVVKLIFCGHAESIGFVISVSHGLIVEAFAKSRLIIFLELVPL